jgi:ribosomal protein L14
LQAFILFVLESIVLVILSCVFPHQHTAESEALVWKSPLEALRSQNAWRGLGDFRVLTVVLIVVMVGLYVWFSGEDTYYSLDGQVTLADGTPVVGTEVSFQCGDERFNFSRTTDADGRYVCATKQHADGAPAGTRYKVKIIPQADLIVRMEEAVEETGGEKVKSERVAKVLYAVPRGTRIRAETVAKDVETEDGRKTRESMDVYSFTLKTDNGKGKTAEKTIQVPRDENVRILPATDVPPRYQSFDTSELSCTVQAVPMFTTERKRHDFQLQ